MTSWSSAASRVVTSRRCGRLRAARSRSSVVSRSACARRSAAYRSASPRRARTVCSASARWAASSSDVVERSSPVSRSACARTNGRVLLGLDPQRGDLGRDPLLERRRVPLGGGPQAVRVLLGVHPQRGDLVGGLLAARRPPRRRRRCAAGRRTGRPRRGPRPARPRPAGAARWCRRRRSGAGPARSARPPRAGRSSRSRTRDRSSLAVRSVAMRSCVASCSTLARSVPSSRSSELRRSLSSVVIALWMRAASRSAEPTSSSARRWAARSVLSASAAAVVRTSSASRRAVATTSATSFSARARSWPEASLARQHPNRQPDTGNFGLVGRVDVVDPVHVLGIGFDLGQVEVDDDRLLVAAHDDARRAARRDWR